MKSKTVYLNNLDFSTNLKKTCEILAKSEVEVTFFGKILLEGKNIRGDLNLNEVAAKVNLVAQERSKSNDLTEDEREYGNLIANRLVTLYLRSDARVLKSNFITQLFVWLRELFTSNQMARKSIADGTTARLFTPLDIQT